MRRPHQLGERAGHVMQLELVMQWEKTGYYVRCQWCGLWFYYGECRNCGGVNIAKKCSPKTDQTMSNTDYF
jgi:hypothetical protein